VLGCGRIAGAIHLPVLAALPAVEIAAVADADAARRAAARRATPGAADFGDFRELLARAEIDAAVVALPNALHAEATRAALARGLHVYVEKPLALAAAEARALAAAGRAAERVAMIGFNYRFNPSHERARTLHRGGRIGALVAMRSVFTTAERDLPAWKRARATGGGALLDLASHQIDLAAWHAGAWPDGVACTLRSRESEDDTALVTLTFAGGPAAQILAAIGAVEEDRFEIVGAGGAIAVDRLVSEEIALRPAGLERARARRLALAARALASPAYWARKARGVPRETSYERAFAAFAEAALARRAARPDLDDGARVQEIVEAAEESARTGRRVALAGGEWRPDR
jgi:predicted dehydrogenase